MSGPTHSRMPEAEDYLLALVAGLDAMADVAVTRTQPTKQSETGARHVWFGENEFTQAHRGGFGQTRDDQFRLTLVALVYQRGDDDDTPRARCWELVTAIQDAVSADPHLGGILNVGADVTGGKMDTYPADTGGWAARAEVRVTNVAVLTSE